MLETNTQTHTYRVAAIRFHFLTISCSKTFPSLVSLMSPAPDTNLGGNHTQIPQGTTLTNKPHIFKVPLGPRLVFKTS